MCLVAGCTLRVKCFKTYLLSDHPHFECFFFLLFHLHGVKDAGTQAYIVFLSNHCYSAYEWRDGYFLLWAWVEMRIPLKACIVLLPALFQSRIQGFDPDSCPNWVSSTLSKSKGSQDGRVVHWIHCIARQYHGYIVYRPSSVLGAGGYRRLSVYRQRIDFNTTV